MSHLLIDILTLSISGSIMIMILFLITRLLKRWVNFRWQYYIWILVIARLLIPFSIKDNLINYAYHNVNIASSIEDPIDDRKTIDTVTAMPVNDNESINESDCTSYSEEGQDLSSDGTYHNILNSDANLSSIHEKMEPATAKKHENSESIGNAMNEFENAINAEKKNSFRVTWLPAIYVGIALSLFIYKIVCYLLFVKKMRATSDQVDDIEQLELLGRLLERKKIKRYVDLRSNAVITTPMIIGYLHPVLMIPQVKMPMEDLEYIIQHELVHLKRKDIIYKWLVQIAVCVHWFNPFVYLMAGEISRECELSCDESVLLELTTEKKHEYGTMLLHAANVAVQRNAMIPMISLHTSKRLLKERLEVIVNGTLHSKKFKTLMNTFTCIICIFALLLGTADVSAADVATNLGLNTNDLVTVSMNFDQLENTNTSGMQNMKTTNVLQGGHKRTKDSVVIEGDYTSEDFDDYKGNSFFFDTGTPHQLKATCTVFEAPYLVVLSWNLVEKQSKDRYTKEWFTSSYKTSKDLTLDDKSNVKIFYTSACKNEVSNKELDSALSNMFASIKKDALYEPFPLDNVLVRNVKKIDKSSYLKVAKENFDNERYGIWYALYRELDEKTQENYRTNIINSENDCAFSYIIDDLSEKQIKEYFEIIYSRKRKNLYGTILDYLDEQTIDDYFKKAYKEKNNDFMEESICYVSDQLRGKIAKKCYEDNNLTMFEELLDDLDNSELDWYIENSYKDKKLSFYEDLAEYMDCEQYDQYIEKSYKDNLLSYFEVLSDDLNDDGFDEYLKKSYKDNKINFFQLLIPDADDDTIRHYYKTAVKENRKKYIEILEEYL